MTRENFNQLNQAQKLEAIWNRGQFISRLSEGKYDYELYAIDNSWSNL